VTPPLTNTSFKKKQPTGKAVLDTHKCWVKETSDHTVLAHPQVYPAMKAITYNHKRRDQLTVPFTSEGSTTKIKKTDSAILKSMIDSI
jgi:hypothetical protein